MQVFEWCRSILSTTPGRWVSLAQNLPAELANRRPLPEEWSALECLAHLLDTERNAFPPRLNNFLAGETLARYTPPAGYELTGGKQLDTLAAEFAALRAENLQLFDRLSEADLERTAVHPTHGPVRLRQFLCQWATHDLVHTMQAEKAILQPFLHGLGAWMVNFREHLIEG